MKANHELERKLMTIFLGYGILTMFGTEDGMATRWVDVPDPLGKCRYNQFYVPKCKEVCGDDNWTARSDCHRGGPLKCECRK